MKQELADQLIRYFELLAGLTGIVCYYKKRQSIWFVFAVFLVCLFGFEALGHYLGIHNMGKYNTNMFKWIVVPLLFGIYHLIFYKINNGPIKKYIAITYLLFLLLVIFENIFLNKTHALQISLSISIGCISLLYFSLYYFFSLVKSDDLLYFKTSMAFWFCCGILLFYLGSFPYFTFFNSLAISKNKTVASNYRWVFIFLNYIMYLLFTIGFICSKPKQSHL
jgi:hypothetical protein